MQLTISTTHFPATDLGYLLHKHPDRLQGFDITAGKAWVFYPEASETKCTATLLVEIDAIDLVRTLKSPGNALMLQHYVNDRPYVASSFTSHAISKVFASAMNGRCDKRPELLGVVMPFEVRVSVVKVNGGVELMDRLFAPLGYAVEAERQLLDAHFPEWGESAYYRLRLTGQVTLSDLLSHLFVLIPVMDADKHYYIGEHEVEKLLDKGAGWLAGHPEKEMIVRRYLKNMSKFAARALAGLEVDSKQYAVGSGQDAVGSGQDGVCNGQYAVGSRQDGVGDEGGLLLVEVGGEEEEVVNEALAVVKERRNGLHYLRLEAALEQIKASGAVSVADLGCGEGKLLRLLLKEKQFERILGMDVSFSSLQRAKENLHFDRMAPKQLERISLIQGSLNYRDARIAGFDAVALVEVIEHLDSDRLGAMTRVVFEFAKPKLVVLTTPNVEYNVKYETLSAGVFRHSDHRFEWTRGEFLEWATGVGERFGYLVEILGVGEVDEVVGSSSQMGVFRLGLAL